MAELIVRGTGFETESERVTADLLQALPASWLVIANKILAVEHGKSFEIDFIVIGDHRIVILDDKYWRGRITGNSETWTLHDSGAARKSPFHQVERNARYLKGYLDHRGIAIPYQTVQPVIGAVVLTHPTSDPHVQDPRATHCLLTRDTVLDGLRWLDREGERGGLDVRRHHAKLRGVIAAEADLHRPRVPARIGLFTVEHLIEEREQCRVFAAVDPDDGLPRVLYVYPPVDPAREKQRDHEHDVLRSLQSTGTVPLIESSFPLGDLGETVTPMRLLPGTAWGALPPVINEAMARRRLQTASVAFANLARLHEAGVIHRRLNPNNIKVQYEHGASPPWVGFEDFSFARLPDGRTIAETLNRQGFDDPYASPLITRMESYEMADQSSDVYSLALVTLETIMGAPLETIISSVQEHQRLPEQANTWPFIPERWIEPLRATYTTALIGGRWLNQPEKSAAEIGAELGAIWQQMETEGASPVPGSAMGNYEFRRTLGAGAFARTDLLFDMVNHNFVAAKHYTRADLLQEQSERIVTEFNMLYRNWHPNFPKPYAPAEPNARVYQLLMEYIEGETLHALLPRIAHDRDAWAKLMEGLLAAVQHLETLGLLHRDIKPDNVMIRDGDGRPILIDFHSSATLDQRDTLAGAPRYWPPEALTMGELPPSTDRYAAAVTLYQALTNELPFADDPSGFGRDLKPALPESLPRELHQVALVLRRALDPDPTHRPQSATDLYAELSRALTIVEPPTPIPPAASPPLADWVKRLRGLFRNSEDGNADNRGLDSQFARESYVETALDTRLWPEILRLQPAVVFLSGNPGDGKTAFLEHVGEILARMGAQQIEKDPSGWEYRLGEHIFRACFDASESVGDYSATEQLTRRLRGHDHQAPDSRLTVLVAINDGRLAELRHELAEDGSHAWFVKQLDRVRAFGGSAASLDEQPVWVVDLKQRAYVSLTPEPETPSVMRQMLMAMVAPEHWPGAEALAKDFPPAENAIALRSPRPDSPADRLEYLLTLVYLRGERHTTIRDLRSALALLITADLSAPSNDEPFARRLTGDADPDAREDEPWADRYWNIAFTTHESRDLVLGALRPLDPARFAHPRLERYLHFRYRQADATTRARLFTSGREIPPPLGDDPVRERNWIAAMKRRLFFEGAVLADGDPVLLNPLALVPYTLAQTLIDFLRGESDGDSLKSILLRGVSRSNAVPLEPPADEVVVLVKQAVEHQVALVKTFPTSAFTLTADRRRGGAADFIESMPRTVVLTHAASGARVRLTLDLVEVLGQLATGLTPSLPELRPLLEELTPFQSTLQRSNAEQLLVIEHGRRHVIRKDGDRIIRQDA